MRDFFKILSLFLFSVFNFSYSQITVPYRVGDKFGISDENGKMIIPAIYDHIDINSNPGNFIATKGNSEKKFTTDFIYKNKIIIKESHYNYFNVDDIFVKAVNISDLERFYGYNGETRQMTTDLYSLSGKNVFHQSYRNISLQYNTRNPQLKDQSLILLQNTSQKYSLVLLDKKTLKVTQTFFEDADDVDVDYRNKPSVYSITHSAAYQPSMKLTINFENGKIKNSLTEKIPLEENNAYRSSSSYPPPPGMGKPYSGESEPKPKITQIYTSKRYTEPFSTEILTLGVKELYQAIIKEVDGKKGYFSIKKDEWIIPAEYEDIMLSDSPCSDCGVYVLKQNNEYRILINEKEKQNIFKGKFELKPYLYKMNYGKDGFHLIKLFDKNGNLFAYANQDGKIYYKQ